MCEKIRRQKRPLHRRGNDMQLLFEIIGHLILAGLLFMLAVITIWYFREIVERLKMKKKKKQLKEPCTNCTEAASLKCNFCTYGGSKAKRYKKDRPDLIENFFFPKVEKVVERVEL